MSDNRYDFAGIQQKWTSVWRERNLYATGEQPDKEKFYCLDFFPYPSGSGLSVGHLRNYVPTDVISRMKRMQGFNVLHPMGWDAFGLPAENYAIKMGVHPAVTTAQNAAIYRRQLSLVECSYDWEREINSTDPDYYRWTQWFFLLLFKRGLAYQETGMQWFCELCPSVLANEQVVDGKCWRHDSPNDPEVVKRPMRQWYFRITEYADRLLKDLDLVDWPEHIKKMQENWIGRRTGTEVIFTGKSPDSAATYPIPIFTTRIDTIFGVTFMTLAPEHPLVAKLTHPDQRAAVEDYIQQAAAKTEVDRLSTDKEKTGVPLGSVAINPFNGREIPIFIGDYVLHGYGTGAVMAVPAHDERDFAFAQKYSLPIREVITPSGTAQGELSAAFTEYGSMIDSGEFSGLHSSEGIERMTVWVEQQQLGTRRVNYKLRDWLISRQRYWGAPIPIIHCAACGAVPVPEDQLPVVLPADIEFRPGDDGRSPLSRAEAWVNVSCPVCGQPARRETDTMDGFACSSWYFLRFLDPHLNSAPFSPEKGRYWLPVDLYVGGAEHAVMHLLYARFWTKVMQDAGIVDFPEPFMKLRNQGMMLAADGSKMSKSKNNVITPDEMVEQYGADTLRSYLLFLGTFELEVAWSDDGIRGVSRFINRVFDLICAHPGGTGAAIGDKAADLQHIIHRTIKAVTTDIGNFSFNTAIARLMELTNALSDWSRTTDLPDSALWRTATTTLLRLLAPIAPFLTEELWHRIGEPGSVHQQSWPVWDETALELTEMTLPVQVNGKLRDQLTFPVEITAEDIRTQCEASPKLQKYLEGKQIIRFIYVPKRMVSFVVK